VKTRLLLAVSAALLLASPALADTLATAAPFSPWQNPTQGNVPPFSGTPFWDNVSKDGNAALPGGNNCNVGYWVSNTGNCSVAGFYANSPGATGPYLGDGTASVMFNADGSVNTVRASVGVSALSATTEFGWFTRPDPADPARTETHQILSGASMGSTVSFSVPSGSYGFYVTVVDPRPSAVIPNVTWFSDQTDALNRTHFALFDLGGGHYALGIEDKQGLLVGDPYWSDYDYNDLVVEITTAVPEPASFLLLGIGLLGGGAMLRRRKK